MYDLAIFQKNCHFWHLAVIPCVFSHPPPSPFLVKFSGKRLDNRGQGVILIILITVAKVYTEPMEDAPINLASKSSHQPIVDSNSNQVKIQTTM